MRAKQQAPLLILCLLITVGCAPIKTKNNGGDTALVTGNQTAPSLYLSHCLALADQLRSGYYRGLGSGRNLRIAKQQAYQDIAEQLSVTVHSQSSNTTTKQYTAQSDRENTAVNIYWQQKIEAASAAQLDQLSLDCLDRQDPSGNIHLALLYDSRPQSTRFAEDIIESIGYQPRELHLQGPQSLISSDLIVTTLEKVESTEGQFDFSSNLQLDKKNDRWQLITADSTINLPETELSHAINWQQLNAGDIDMVATDINGERLALQLPNETEFRWVITPSISGYLQVIGIYQNGDFDILRQDIPARAQQSLTIPENNGVFETGLLANDTTTDVYLSLVTSQPLEQTSLASALAHSQLGPHLSLTKFLSTLEGIQAQKVVRVMMIEP